VLFASPPLAARLGGAVLGGSVDELLPRFRDTVGRGLCDNALRLYAVPLSDEERVDVCVLADHAPLLASGFALSAANLQQVARITHDLNNVFTIIYAGLAMVLAHEMSAEERYDCLAQAQAAARNGSQMVTEIRQLIGREPQPHSAPPQESSVEAAYTPRDGHEKVLLASTQMSLRLHLRAVLAYRGYEVLETATPAEALSRSDAQLVITDDVALALVWHTKSGSAPLLLVAEQDCPAPAPDGHWLGVPFENMMLLAKVRTVLDQSSSGAGEK